MKRVFWVQPDQDEGEGKNESQFSQLIDGNFSEFPLLRAPISFTFMSFDASMNSI